MTLPTRTATGTPPGTPPLVQERPDPLQRLLRPRSVAVVGASDDPATIGGAPLVLLERFGYQGEVHLVSKTRKQVNGRKCLSSLDELPEGVDAAVLAIPKPGVAEAVEAAARRGIGGVAVFSSGYAELGPAGAAEQDDLARLARELGVALAGPNCLGLVNFVDGVPLTFGDVAPNRYAGRRALAIVAQSGALSLALTYAAQAQGVPVSYTVSTGNEAVLGIEDYLPELLQDERTGAVALLVEQVRRPADLLALARSARQGGKPLVLLHPGRSARAAEASRSHTGAIAGEQGPLRAVLSREGVVFVSSLDELVDTAGLMCQVPLPRTGAAAFMTDSGAAKTLAIDHCSALGLELAELSNSTLERLAGELPAFATASNPVDITASGLNDPSLYARVLEALLADDAVGTAVVAAMPGSELQGAQQVDALLPSLMAAEKPTVYAVFGGAWPIMPANEARVREAGVPLFRSMDRALQAVRNISACATAFRAADGRPPALSLPPLSLPGLATNRLLGEVEAKAALAGAGLKVPASELVGDVGGAHQAARRLGYPLALKVSAPGLYHKSDAGGVALVQAERDLDGAFARLVASVSARRPELAVTGVLVEEAVLGGAELIVGARRDAGWGPYVLAGLGGIWADALDDWVIVPADATPAETRAAIATLKGFPLLAGAHGGPRRDLEALVAAIEVLGALLRATPEVAEIEVNPLAVLDEGRGVIALDAVITLGAWAHR